MINHLRKNHGNGESFFKCMKIYNRIRILNTVFNHSMCEFAWPIYNIMSCILFVGGFCAAIIKATDGAWIVKVIGGFTMVLSISILLASMILFAQIHSSSWELYENILRHRPLGRLNGVLSRAYIVTGINSGLFFVVKEQTLFTVLQELSDTAISTLLSFN
ncbi:unnamed protein product [Orchesella dallaii]|uniref:Uncharacterized protein n=1 Tax=Orchesella dallaii TaxID=48710 RepID=A0ABP1RIA5_9HEXA